MRSRVRRGSVGAQGSKTCVFRTAWGALCGWADAETHGYDTPLLKTIYICNKKCIYKVDVNFFYKKPLALRRWDPDAWGRSNLTSSLPRGVTRQGKV